MGSQVEAADILEKLLIADKSQTPEAAAESRFALARIYYALKDEPKVSTHLRSLMRSAGGDNARYLTFYLQFLLKHEDVGEAELWLPRLVSLAPGEVNTLWLSAEIHFRQKRYDELLTLTDKFMSLAKKNSPERPNREQQAATLP